MEISNSAIWPAGGEGQQEIDVVRLFYYKEDLPYYMDHGRPLNVGDTLTIEGIPYKVNRTRNVPENEEQRLWIS